MDGGAFDVTLSDDPHTVRARVFVDERGAPFDFHTDDRWFASPGEKPVRTRWTTPVEGYRVLDGRMLPSRGRATWKATWGDPNYAGFQFGPGDLVFGVAPGAVGGS